MRKTLPLLLLILGQATILFAQKKPLDHSAYDQWQSVSERKISPNGQWIVYTVTPQEGDGKLVIQSFNGSYSKTIDRGYNATILSDNKFLVYRIRPFFKDTREARIKKKSPNDMPKDTLVVQLLGTDSIVKYTKFKTFRTPEKNGAWLAVHLEKAPADTSARKKTPTANAAVDSLKKVIDSLTLILNTQAETGNKRKRNRDDGEWSAFFADSTLPNKRIEEGTELLLRNLNTGEERRFPFINEFLFDQQGKTLVTEVTPNKKDSTSQLHVVWTDLSTGNAKTIFTGGNDIKSYGFDDAGTQIAFIVEKDSSAKALQKFYQLYHFKKGMDSAQFRANRFTAGIPSGFTISENANVNFSKNGERLFFGTSPIRAPKDTTLVDFETARLDVWHYADDYLQPMQLKQLNLELNRSYTAVLNAGATTVLQLGSPDLETITLVNEGNAPYVLGVSNKEGRIALQWTGSTLNKAMIVSLKDGSRKLVKEKASSFFSPSPNGNFITWYNTPDRHYYSYEVATGITRNITSKITVPLYDEEDDHPDDPSPHGTSGWLENDAALLVNDRYDTWEVDPTGKKAPLNITAAAGRKARTVLRVVRFNREERFLSTKEPWILEGFARNTKYSGFYELQPGSGKAPVELYMGPYTFTTPLKADSAKVYLVGRMNIKESSDLYSTADLTSFSKRTNLNPQQEQYNWLTVELTKWKIFDGKMAEGLLYKPENFDPKKKYPVIFYFYEKNADGLYTYKTPAPSASTVNIAYFVSNGYIVFDPNIYYKTGQPGEDAYNSVVSAAQYLAAQPWVDAKKMAIQGQSWGGYQVAYLVTRTNMFAAAGAGAPVANMTSAYGGIRWGTGMNRQFQYERTQSRIGATLWERPDLYIKNSPLFAAPKVNTPLLLMHNDEDGAVPWYQGIEYFTALRRLGKKVWLLQYNGEDHNLVERRNRKDLSIRLAQFFDHYLKGAPAPVWMKTGVPAIEKGKTWGLEME